MQQTRLGSFIESVMNVAIGYFIALATQLVVFPLFDIHIAFVTNLWIGACFTVISVIRSYVIRRWFNARLHNAAMAIERGIHHG